MSMAIDMWACHGGPQDGAATKLAPERQRPWGRLVTTRYHEPLFEGGSRLKPAWTLAFSRFDSPANSPQRVIQGVNVNGR